MMEIANSLGVNSIEIEQLVGGLEEANILFSSSMVQWLSQHNVRIYDVKELIHFSRKQPFQKFTAQIANMRKKAEEDKNILLSTTAKALGNSSYGFTLNAAQTGVDTRYVHASSIQKDIRSERFLGLETLERDYFEVSMTKNGNRKFTDSDRFPGLCTI